MKNKNAFLLAEETLKIIIALISITFLIYFLTSLYFNNKDKQDLEFAEASLNHLINEINSGAESVGIYNPKDWVLTSWPRDTSKSRIFYDDIINDDIPNSCSNLGWEKCLCICDDSINFEGKDCDDLGICTESNLKVGGDKIKIENPPLVLSINEEGEISKR